MWCAGCFFVFAEEKATEQTAQPVVATQAEAQVAPAVVER